MNLHDVGKMLNPTSFPDQPLALRKEFVKPMHRNPNYTQVEVRAAWFWFQLGRKSMAREVASKAF